MHCCVKFLYNCCLVSLFAHSGKPVLVRIRRLRELEKKEEFPYLMVQCHVRPDFTFGGGGAGDEAMPWGRAGGPGWPCQLKEFASGAVCGRMLWLTFQGWVILLRDAVCVWEWVAVRGAETGGHSQGT